MAKVDLKLRTGMVRFSFARVFEPESFAGGAPKYSVQLLIPKTDAAFMARYDEVLSRAKDHGRTEKWGGKVPSGLDLPLRDGDERFEEDPETYEAYKGHWYIAAKKVAEKGRPDVLKPAGKDAQGKNILVEIADSTEFYSGCYGRALITLWPFAEAGNRGITALLDGVVKLQDGEAFGSSGGTKNAFADEDFGLDDDDELD